MPETGPPSNHISQDRLRSLLAANRSIVSELSLSAVLEKIVAAARDVAEAQYAALGVIAVDGTLEEFLHIGMEPALVAQIGELPKGRGVLGALIEHPEPIRLKTISDDTRSSGFPPHHPPMTTFLGVPITSRESVFGNLYLTDRIDGKPFTTEDEELVLALAATAGIAIENARLYEESRRRQEWLRASGEISRDLLLAKDDETTLLQSIADSVKRLADADIVTIVLPDPRNAHRFQVAVATGTGAANLRGYSYDGERTLTAVAMRERRGILVDSLEDRDDLYVHLRTAAPVDAVMAVPLKGDWTPRGAIVVGRIKGRHRLTRDDLEMAEAFASQAAIALELSEAHADQAKLSVLEDRDRIARDLHDHVIQRLFAAGLSMQSVAAAITDEVVQARVTRTVNDLDDTIRQIRSSIFALRALETNRALRSMVLALVVDIEPMLPTAPNVLFAGPVDTLTDDHVTADVSAVIREGLVNIARHASASTITIEIAAEVGNLTVTIRDDGTGIGETTRRSGLANLRQRAEAQGGHLHLTPTKDDGTGLCLQWSIPLTT